MLKENAEDPETEIKLLNLILEEEVVEQLIIPNKFVQLGLWKTVVYAESDHWLGKNATKYPVEGKIIDGIIENMY